MGRLRRWPEMDQSQLGDTSNLKHPIRCSSHTAEKKGEEGQVEAVLGTWPMSALQQIADIITAEGVWGGG